MSFQRIFLNPSMLSGQLSAFYLFCSFLFSQSKLKQFLISYASIQQNQDKPRKQVLCQLFAQTISHATPLASLWINNNLDVRSFSTLHLDDQFVAALAATILADQKVDILFCLSGKENAADLWSALWQFQLLKQFSVFVEKGEATVFRKSTEFEQGSDDDVVVGRGDGSWPKSTIELMEKTTQIYAYLMQQIPSLDSQNRMMRFFPVSETQMILSSWLKVKPVGALRQRRAIERILCCCMSITNRLPLVFADTFSPKAPQSVKKILPVLLDRMSE